MRLRSPLVLAKRRTNSAHTVIKSIISANVYFEFYGTGYIIDKLSKV